MKKESNRSFNPIDYQHKTTSFYTKGDTVFGIVRNGEEEGATEMLDKFVKELVHNINKKGDRNFAINAAIIIENLIDNALGLLLPKYKIVMEDNNITFSRKINLLDSFNLIPDDIFAQIDCLRKIRNAFAHQLKYSTFDELPPAIINKTSYIYSNLIGVDKNEKDLFEQVNQIFISVTLRLWDFENTFYGYRKFIDSEEFKIALKDYIKQLNAEYVKTHHQELINDTSVAK